MTITTIAISLPLLFLLPGLLTWLAMHGSTTEEKSLSRQEIWFQILVFSILCSGGLGVILSQVGLLNLRTLLACNAIYSGVLSIWNGYRGRLRWPGPVGRDRSIWCLLVLIIVSAALFFHPHEFLFGGADAGVYVNLGRNIAESGSWLVDEPEIATLAPALMPGMFREQQPTATTHYLQFPGFYLDDNVPGRVIPQFYALHPVWMAILNMLGGLRLSLYATPLWGVLGVVALYFAAQKLFGTRIGFVAALFLTLTATQIWFSRYPTAEVLTQFLLFGGLYALAHYAVDQSPWMGLLAGLALGQTMLVRIDVYFLLAIPVGYALYLRLLGTLHRKHLGFFLPFLIEAAYSIFWALTQSYPYFRDVYGFGLRSLPWPVIFGLGIPGIAGYVVLDHWAGRNRQWPERLAPYWHRLMTVLAVVVVVAALYAYFIRPALADTSQTWNYWYGGHQIPNVEPFNFVRLGWYLSPLGLVLAVAGVWRTLRKQPDLATLVFLGVGLFFSFLFVYRTYNNPHHIYVMRRYVPAVIPFMMTMAAIALEPWFARRGYLRWIGAGMALLLCCWLTYNARFVMLHVEYRGAVEQFDALTERLGDSDGTIILFNDDLPVSSGAQLGTPLHYLYDYTVFDMQEPSVDPDLLLAQIRRWQQEGWRVLLAEGSHKVVGFLDRASLIPLVDYEFVLPHLEGSYEHFPRKILETRIPIVVFEIAPLR